MTETKQRYVQNEGLATAVLDGESVILNTERGFYFGTNELGTQIFTLLEEPRTHEQLVTSLAPKYDVEEDRLSDDIAQFLAQLEENGLIRSIPAEEQG